MSIKISRRVLRKEEYQGSEIVRGVQNEVNFEDIVRSYIQNSLKPQIEKNGIVYKRLDRLSSITDGQMAYGMYVLASEFDMNAKISYNAGESCYTFWLGNDD